MGFNTTVVVLNDALHDIKEDKEFGKKLADAISHRSVTKDGVDVSAGSHMNAARVIETHHADGLEAVLVGGNCGEDLGYIGSWQLDPGTPEGRKEVLRSLARLFGMKISIRDK